VVTGTRTLDLAAESSRDCSDWKKALISLLVSMAPRSAASQAKDASLLRDKPSWNSGDYGNSSSNSNNSQPMSLPHPSSVQAPPAQYQEPSQNPSSQWGHLAPAGRRTSVDMMSQDQRLARRDQLREQMFAAARRGDLARLEEALEAGVNVNLMEPVNSDTPLMIACRLGHVGMVRNLTNF
jgi:hypothetical protein